MPEIPEIGVQRISVPEILEWRSLPPQSIPNEPPITLQLGFPVADIPGCVETRTSAAGDEQVYTDDPRGNLVVCGAEMPSYKPLVVPPSDLRPPPGVKGTTQSDKEKPKPKPPPVKLPQDTRQVDVPFTDVTMPLPSNEILVTAGTTATVSVAATLTATAVFKWTVNVMKPILKQAWTKITKRKGSSNSSSLSGPPDS